MSEGLAIVGLLAVWTLIFVGAGLVGWLAAQDAKRDTDAMRDWDRFQSFGDRAHNNVTGPRVQPGPGRNQRRGSDRRSHPAS